MGGQNHFSPIPRQCHQVEYLALRKETTYMAKETRPSIIKGGTTRRTASTDFLITPLGLEQVEIVVNNSF